MRTKEQGFKITVNRHDCNDYLFNSYASILLRAQYNIYVLKYDWDDNNKENALSLNYAIAQYIPHIIHAHSKRWYIFASHIKWYVKLFLHTYMCKANESALLCNFRCSVPICVELCFVEFTRNVSSSHCISPIGWYL